MNDDAISAFSGGARDPVDGTSSADPFAGHGISALAQPGERRPRGVRQPSRSPGQIDDGRAIRPPQQDNHPRQLATVSRGARLGVFADVLRKSTRLGRIY